MKIVAWTALILVTVTTAYAFPGAGKMAREFSEAIVKRYGDDATRELAEFGGERAVRESLEKAAQQGGEALAESLVRYGDQYGMSAFRALSKDADTFIRALDEIPTAFAGKAVHAVERNADELAELIVHHGPDALEVAARHPGVGELAIRKLGADAVPIARKLEEKEFMTFTRFMDDIGSLPAPQKATTLDTVLRAPGAALGFLENHPRILKYGTGAAVALVYKDGVISVVHQVVGVGGAVLGVETTTPDGTTITPPKTQQWAASIAIVVLALCGGGAIFVRARRRASRPPQ